MKPTDYQFLTDCFWPVIIGQFGIVGLAFYITLLYIIINYVENDDGTYSVQKSNKPKIDDNKLIIGDAEIQFGENGLEINDDGTMQDPVFEFFNNTNC